MNLYEMGAVVGVTLTTVFWLCVYFVIVRPAAQSRDRCWRLQVRCQDSILRAWQSQLAETKFKLHRSEAQLRAIRGAQTIERLAAKDSPDPHVAQASYAEVDQPQGKYCHETNAILKEQDR